MTREVGRIVAVSTSLAGDELAADAASGATTIIVADAADFDEAGGLLQVTHDVPTELDPVNAPGVMTNVLTDVTYTYAAVDDDTGAVTLVDPLIAAALTGDRVTILDPQTQAPAQEVVAEVALQGFDSDDSVEAIVDHALAAHLPEGIREGDGEVVSLEWRDDELRVVNIIDQTPGLNSDAGGWSLDDAGGSFSDLQVVGGIGVSSLTADAIELGGSDLQTEILDPMPRGLIVHVKPVSGTNSAQSAAEQVVFRVNAGTLYADRFYRVSYGGTFQAAALVAGDVYQTSLRYTGDGSTPTTSSLIMDRSIARHYVGNSTQVVSFYRSWFYTPAATLDNVRFAFTTMRNVGTGFPVIKNDDDNYGFFIAVEDMGLQTNVGGTISQISKATGSADGEPTATYTRSWTALWGRPFTYQASSGAYEPVSSNTELLQGTIPGTSSGNTRSQIGFDDSDIRAKLTGATIQKVTLTFRVKSAVDSRGVTLRFSTHGNSSLPASWTGTSSVVASKSGGKAGSTYTVTLPNSVGNSFKSGSARGIAIGPGDTAALIYSGSLYGVNAASAPKLTITYSR